jgi:hypothetical protein
MNSVTTTTTTETTTEDSPILDFFLEKYKMVHADLFISSTTIITTKVLGTGKYKFNRVSFRCVGNEAKKDRF